MWREAAYVASYLHNRSPTKTTDVTPVEKWSKKKPQLKNIRLSGCDAYAKVLGPLKKLDERSRKYNFIGYAPVGYRLWDAEKKKIIITRDVQFSERTEKNTTREREEEN